MLKLNIYKNQKEVEKTFEIDGYDIMYGTVEDILQVLDDMDDLTDNMKILQVVTKNRKKLNELLLEVFPDMTDDDVRKVKIKELIPFFLDLFSFIRDSFSNEKN